jgi:hypothetical protein
MVDTVVVGLNRDHVVRERDRLVGVLLKLGDGSFDERWFNIQDTERVGLKNPFERLMSNSGVGM